MAKQINLGKVKGDNATINGVNALTIEGNNGITASQSGSVLTLSAPSVGNHLNDTSNPHAVTKAQVGLSNVDNVSEATILSDAEASIMTSAKIQAALGYTPANAANIPDSSNIESIAESVVTTENIVAALGYTPANSATAGVTSQSIETALGYTPADASIVSTSLQNNNTSVPTGAAVKTAIDSAVSNVNVTCDSSFVANSTNPVESRVIKSALDTKMEKVAGNPGQILAYDDNGDIYAADPAADLGIKQSAVTSSDKNVYGFTLNSNESNPASMITYIGANAEFTPAYMGSAAFDYGDWADAFFIKDLKVAIIDQNGNILEELDKDDYTKKTDGTASSITSPSNNGNVMVGIPTVWIKVDVSNSARPKYYFSSYQVDDSYNAYAHTNEDGVVVPYIWMSAYNGWDDGTRLRSVSGKTLTASQTGTVQIQKAEANNASGKHNWTISVLCDRQLITLLLMLIGRNTNSQATFGNGVTSGGESAVIKTGTMDKKGLFWGSTSSTTLGVKVFGIENMWGNVYDRTHGLILSSGKMLAKLTYGTQDGSNTNGYNTDGTGYIDTGIDFSSASATSGYIKHMKATKWGLFMDDLSGGSETTYYCDYGYITKTGVLFALWGGYSYNGAYCGSYYCNLYFAVSGSYLTYGARVSMKPSA